MTRALRAEPRSTALCEVVADNATWQVPVAHRDQLFGPVSLRLDEWLATGQASLIKHGPHRTVYHVCLPGFDFYLKHYRVHDIRARLRQLVRPAKARAEFERTLEVKRRGVPTFTPIGLGECHGGPAAGESYLLTKTLAGTEPVDAFIQRTLPQLDPHRRPGVRQRLAAALGRLMRQIHDAGIRHRDLHAGNVLVRLEGGDDLSLYLIDLHAVTLGRALGVRARGDNLIMFNRWFVVRASAADRLRFWHAYVESGEADLGSRLQPIDLERRTWESFRTFWLRRDRRCLGANKYFERLRRQGPTGLVTAHVSRDLDHADRDNLLANPDEPFQKSGIRLLKDSRSATVAEFDIRLRGEIRRVVYKRFRVTKWTDPLANLCRPTGSLRSWVLGHGLLDRALPTARPFAVLHRRHHGLVYESYLLAEKIDGCVDLHGFLARLAELNPADRLACLRIRIDQIARLVRDLHRRHLTHRDLKAANVLTPPPGRPAPGYGCWLIDLVGVRRCRRISPARRVQNLARLNASFLQSPAITRTERLRFLRTYLQWHLHGRQSWRDWWRDIERATCAKVMRNQRNGRPLE